MSDLETAWLAGVFDGEGTINLIKNPKLKRSPFYTRMSVTNTFYPLLERIVEVTGTGRIISQRRATERHSAAWIWMCHGRNAHTLLRQMLPWLIVKKDKATQALVEADAAEQQRDAAEQQRLEARAM